MKTPLSSIFLLTILLSVNQVNAQVYETVRSGSWTTSNTWAGGVIPPAGLNNAIIRINEGHTVSFSANAANYNYGNGVTFDILGSLTIQGWGTFKVGNNATFNVSGSMTIPSNNRFETGNTSEFVISGTFTNSTNSTFGNNALFTILESGVMVNTGSVTAGNNTVFNIDGTFRNQNYQMILNDDASFTIGPDGTFINQTLFQANDGFWMVVDGDVVNSGHRFIVRNDAEILINESGAITTSSNMRFGESLFMTVDGTLNIAGWDFVVGSGSQMILAGNVHVDNHHVFKSNNMDNTIYSCNASINNIDYFKNVTLLDCSALPVELLFFEANAFETTVELVWATASEINSDYFQIERSNDGFAWETVSIVNAAGNSNYTINYSYTHATPSQGINYYRLKQVDFDGAYEYFALVAVEVNTHNMFGIVGVERAGHQVIVTAPFSSGGQLTVFNAMGNIIASQSFSGDAFSATFPYSEKSGVVVIHYTNAPKGEFSSSKFMIR